MAQLDLAATMDALAAKLVAGSVAVKRVSAWPDEALSPPCVVIDYPEEIEYDLTFGRGSDEAVFPIWFLVGKVTGKASRDALSAVVSGANAASIKAVLDGPLTVGSNTADVRVLSCKPAAFVLGSTTYLGGRFDTEVTT